MNAIPYLQEAIARLLSDIGDLPDDFRIEFDRPQRPEHGDLSCNVAMRLARTFKKSPRDIGLAIAEGLRALPADPDIIETVDVAGPGFLNFRFSHAYLVNGLADILSEGSTFGRSDRDRGKSALVEFVSANPTGPLTVGHGRNAVLGDTIANLLEATGYAVTREYYFNDAGRQMRILGQSLKARVEGALDPGGPTRNVEGPDGTAVEVPASFPEDGYQGSYLIDIARDLVKSSEPAELREAPDEFFEHSARDAIFKEIEATLERLSVSVDSYFNERTVYDDGRVWDIVSSLRERDLAYEDDGAVWFRTTTFGKEKDTVLVKSSGEPTYRLPDIAYHVDKLERGFDLVIDIFGADHGDTYPDIVNAVHSLGHDASKIDVVIYQFVTLVAGGEPVKMSTRRATYVTLDELMNEVGTDVTRFFFLMRSPGSHLDFDLNLARQEREKNPVFYLQYAHARICSIIRKAEEVGFSFSQNPDLSVLTHPSERELMRTLLEYPVQLERIGDAREPHRLIVFLNDVATRFTGFYDACRIIGEAAELASARMALAEATRTVLHNGLGILGISAPERM